MQFTDEVEGGLMVLFFDLAFPLRPPSPLKNFCRRPWNHLTGK